METTNITSADFVDFLNHVDTQRLLAPVDFALRNGQHLQAEHPAQTEWFRFVVAHTSALSFYYRTYFGLRLEERREGTRRYFYLSTQSGEAGRIPDDYREPLSAETIIVAMLLCKVSLIDIQRHSFPSIEELLDFLHDEYEEYHEGLFKQLAHLTGNDAMRRDEQRVQKLVKRAMKEFARLGWVHRSADGVWHILPALNRIREMYETEISQLNLRYTTPTQ